MKETILSKISKNLNSYKFLTSITGKISDRAKRKFEKLCGEAYTRLKKKDKLPENSETILNLKWDDYSYNWARNLSLSLEEFRQVYPKYGKKLDEIIKKHRSCRRAYLEFGISPNQAIPREYYLFAIRKIIPTLDDDSAIKLYESLMIADSKLSKKKNQGLMKMLLPE